MRRSPPTHATIAWADPLALTERELLSLMLKSFAVNRRVVLFLLATAGLALTVSVWRSVSTRHEALVADQFARELDWRRLEIHRRIDRIVEGLVAARALTSASERVTASEWRSLLRTMQDRQDPGVLMGVALVTKTPEQELERGAPMLTLTYRDLWDDRFKSSMTALEQTPGALVPLIRAHESRQAVFSSTLSVIDPQGRDGLAAVALPMTLPVGLDEGYQTARRLRWVVALVDPRGLADLTAVGATDEIKLTLYDRPPSVEASLGFDQKPRRLAEPCEFEAPLPIGASVWTIEACPTESFFAARVDHTGPLVLIFGISTTALLFVLVASLYRRNEQAETLARRMIENLEVSEAQAEKLALVAARTDNAVIIADARGRIEWANDSLLRLTNRPASELVNLRATRLLDRSEASRDALRALIDQLQAEDGAQAELSIRGDEEDAAFWAMSDVQIVRGADGSIENYIVVARDMTERRNAERQLLHSSTHDALTGLPNRAVFMETLGRCIERAKEEPDYAFAVLFLDLDRFKVINDSLGHVVGDELLIETSARLRACVREERPGEVSRGADVVARLGGDEFTILLDDITGLEDARRVADRLQREIATPLKLKGHEIATSTSIGIALSDRRYERPEDLLRDADIAMYGAKSAGKARYEVFDQAMHNQMMNRLDLENRLRKALDRKEFELAFQPIVSLSNGRLTGFEALCRWNPIDGDPISPAEFIPIAEETGLIVPLGHWILQEACRVLRGWQERHAGIDDLRLSVNLSVRQLGDRRLHERIRDIVESSGILPNTLCLEITESTIMEDIDAANRLLVALKDLEVGVMMDDFGTGYSSLSCLHQFPMGGLKIDRAFIRSIGLRRDYTAVVQAIVSLAHNLGMRVVAEGLETEDQLIQLQALDCDFGQGYLFAKPLTPKDAELRVAERSRSEVGGFMTMPTDANESDEAAA
ncbi:MAG: putative bifunctional diguanylate cyclase/phosphodiesterase [Phycisphaerales bacterium]